MFLIAENIVTDPKHYFQDIVPAVSQLALSVGGVFVNEMILTSDRQPVAIDQAVFAHPPLTRIVVIHFVSKERFDQFWNSEERHSIWLKGTNYAYFFDTAVHSGSMPMQMQAPPRAAEESSARIARHARSTFSSSPVIFSASPRLTIVTCSSRSSNVQFSS